MIDVLEVIKNELPYASLFWVLVALMFELVRRCKSWNENGKD